MTTAVRTATSALTPTTLVAPTRGGEGAEATPGAAEGATAGAQAEAVDDGNAEDVDGEGHAGKDNEDAVAGAECSQMEPDAPESSRKNEESQSKNKN